MKKHAVLTFWTEEDGKYIVFDYIDPNGGRHEMELAADDNRSRLETRVRQALSECGLFDEVES